MEFSDQKTEALKYTARFQTRNSGKEHLHHRGKNTEVFAYHKGRIVLFVNGAKQQQLDTLLAKYSIVHVFRCSPRQRHTVTVTENLMDVFRNKEKHFIKGHLTALNSTTDHYCRIVAGFFKMKDE